MGTTTVNNAALNQLEALSVLMPKEVNLEFTKDHVKAIAETSSIEERIPHYVALGILVFGQIANKTLDAAAAAGKEGAADLQASLKAARAAADTVH